MSADDGWSPAELARAQAWLDDMQDWLEWARGEHERLVEDMKAQLAQHDRSGLSLTQAPHRTCSRTASAPPR